MSVGYLLHAFDLINVADLDLIRQVGEGCDDVVVGVLTDDEVLADTGRPAVVPQHERLLLVAHVRGVHRAVLHSDAAVPAGATVYAAAGSAAAARSGCTALTAHRETASVLLRDALEPVREEVA